MSLRRPEIILIGPMGAGKSTLGRLLADRLGMSLCALDEIGWTYYCAAGFDADEERRLRAAHGWVASLRYWAPFNLDALERVLADYHDCVFDCGAGHSVYDDPAHLARAQRALAPFPNVVLVLPSPDPVTAASVLRARRPPPSDDGFDLATYAASHPANRLLARHVVYTEDKTPEETRGEVLDRLGLIALP
jgi:hypothetical protein